MIHHIFVRRKVGEFHPGVYLCRGESVRAFRNLQDTIGDVIVREATQAEKAEWWRMSEATGQECGRVRNPERIYMNQEAI